MSQMAGIEQVSVDRSTLKGLLGTRREQELFEALGILLPLAINS